MGVRGFSGTTQMFAPDFPDAAVILDMALYNLTA
jgi:hypothetical protein